jgi:predicted RNA-binding protein with PUA-like domain
MVDVRADRKVPNEIPLSLIRQHPALQDMPLVKRSRLSVQPLTEQQYRLILQLGGIE